MKKIRVVIADDHSVVREGLRAVFQSAPDIHVVAEASDGEEAIRVVSEKQPDVAIIDVSMPKVNGVEATRAIKRNHPEAKILILTIHENEEYVIQMVRAGADGYVLKDASKRDLFSAVRAVASGERFFSSRISRLMIDDFVRRAQKPVVHHEPGQQALTKRETEILQHVAQGLTSKEIAEQLFLSTRTVNTHRTNLMQKLNIHDTAGLVRFAIESGIVKANS